jgi:hypothetical protein
MCTLILYIPAAFEAARSRRRIERTRAASSACAACRTSAHGRFCAIYVIADTFGAVALSTGGC